MAIDGPCEQLPGKRASSLGVSPQDSLDSVVPGLRLNPLQGLSIDNGRVIAVITHSLVVDITDVDPTR